MYSAISFNKKNGWRYRERFLTARFIVLAHLFVKVSRPGDSEETFSAFETSCHCTTIHYSNSEVNPVKCLAQKHNKRLPACSRTIPLMLSTVELPNHA